MSIARTALVALLCIPATAQAQVKLEVTPFFTSYYATNELRFVDNNNLERQEAAPGLGTALTWRFNNVWAVEGVVAYIRSGVIVKDNFLNIEAPTEGHLLMSSARLLFQPRRTNIYFAVGAGNTARGGAAFDVPGLEDKSDFSGIVGFGVRSRVSPQWGFRIGAELHSYRTNIDGDNDYYQDRLQRDVIVTIGVPFALVGR